MGCEDEIRRKASQLFGNVSTSPRRPGHENRHEETTLVPGARGEELVQLINGQEFGDRAFGDPEPLDDRSRIDEAAARMP